MRNNISIQNKGVTPTFAPPYDEERRTIIDLTLTNELAELLIHTWKVDTENPSFSDHRKILFSVSNVEVKEATIARLLRKAKWSRYTDSFMIENDTTWPVEAHDVDPAAEGLNRCLLKALDYTAPK